MVFNGTHFWSISSSFYFLVYFDQSLDYYYQVDKLNHLLGYSASFGCLFGFCYRRVECWVVLLQNACYSHHMTQYLHYPILSIIIILFLMFSNKCKSILVRRKWWCWWGGGPARIWRRVGGESWGLIGLWATVITNCIYSTPDSLALCSRIF